MPEPSKNIARILAGDQRAGAQMIRLIETGDPRVTGLVRDLTLEKIMGFMETAPEYRQILNQLESRKMDPFTAAEQVVQKMLKSNIKGR